MRASVLDLVSLYMDAAERPLDFGLVLRLTSDELRHEDLLAGQISAQRRYPVARSILQGADWAPAPAPIPRLARVETGDPAGDIETFMASPLDPAAEAPFSQLELETPGGRLLVTKFHHAAADLMSAVLFVRHQLAVARGTNLRLDRDAPLRPLRLRSHPAPVRKSRFAHAGPSTRLFARRPGQSRVRRFRTVEVDRAALAGMAAGRGFTYNDLLGRCLLLAARRFNDAHGAATRKLALWFPVNIRSSPFEGFGNGSSRIRIYEDALNGSFVDGLRGFRAQVDWCKAHGEWAVPEDAAILRLPERLRIPAVRAYLGRPWVDMATILYSHAERLEGEGQDPFPDCDDVEVIAELAPHHPVGVAGVTHRGRTRLTFTWDPGMLDPGDLDELVALYQRELTLARGRLA